MKLVCHQTTLSRRVEAIEVSFARQIGNRLWLRFNVDGQIDTLHLPNPVAADRTDSLWKTTCFEAFLRIPGTPAYAEYNFAPSSAWAAYRFDHYRAGMADLVLAGVPEIRIDASDSHFALEAIFALPDCWADKPLMLGLSAVIAETGGHKSYWALAHPSKKPDFHHEGCFAVQLGASKTTMKFGIDRLLADPALRAPLHGKRVALLAHPASVTADLTHSLDGLIACGDINVTAAFGPQHGLRGDKQDNMVESRDFTDPVHGIVVFSLYGEVRRPSGKMMGSFDTILIDLQDLGCRIYTFITTLRYILEAAAEHGKSVWVLDRPNPAGRPVEGLTLRAGWESFVGAGPMPMRHGLTLGELGHWFIKTLGLSVDYQVIAMEGYDPDTAPGFGWPLDERIWINPSPNAPNLNMARAYAGTVMLEGTTLSEGRGTTRPLEIFGAPDIDARAVIAQMQRFAPQWLSGCILREIWFEPTFHKHAGKLCHGVQIHAESTPYDHNAFRPWRLQALAFKAIRTLYPDYDLWRDFPYEYELGKLAIDVINGGPLLRLWVDNPSATPSDLDAITCPDEQAWLAQRSEYLLY